MKNTNGGKQKLLTHNNSKFLFYKFNDHLNRINQSVQLVRHSKMSDDDYVLFRTKKLTIFSWQNFTTFRWWYLAIELASLVTAADINENKWILDTIEFIYYSKSL